MFGFREFKGHFCKDNQLRLLINGEEFFPQLLRRIKHAKREILIETFILENDRVGNALKTALIGAAKRGVWVGVTADSWGSHFLNPEYIEELTAAGIVFQIYDPQPEWYNGRPKLFRRLHRKIAVIDATYGFIGGINLCNDHMITSGPEGKQDYSVELQGPIVNELRELCKSYVRDSNDDHLQEFSDKLKNPDRPGNTPMAFVSRDNRRNRSDIEKAYLAGIHEAKERVWIANAYFFPGYRFMRALRKAAKRGVDVRLVLQGDPDIPFALPMARALYDVLLRNGVKIYEYRDRPLHAKIAVIDDEWSTIGSSNLDPLSLAFNLEANIIVRDSQFNAQLAEQIEMLEHHSTEIESDWVKHRRWYYLVKDFFMYHSLRHFPTFAGLFPAHTPKIRELKSHFETGEGRTRDADLHRQYPESKNARRITSKQDYDTNAEIEAKEAEV
ncbi:cardiolipin synthase ClsB [Gilvimarinus agarilyticus]|uniref:cardiolipin synthase ClsB n=1 Tax=Gilvimarinus agarilyticus TaxID=679259 RepID=UPI0005A15579|nr:cardiolipin synthase ClsB [Gilvimarinus agarilyticus]